MEYRLYIFDALSGKLRVSAERFMTVGAGDTSTFRVEMKVRTGGTFAIRGDICRFFPHGLVKDFSINGSHPARDVRIRPSALYLMTLAGGCLICWFGTDEDMPDFSAYDITKWYVYNLSEKSWSGAIPLPEICKLGDALPADALVAFEGMSHCAFPAKDIVEVSQFAGTLNRFMPAEKEERETLEPQSSLLRCPFCWGDFAEADILAIASQPQLKGDSLLGEHAMRRFKPTNFTPQGLPVDDGGAPCRGTACPHCHSKLPPFYAELRPHIISLIGVRGSGKTYYQTTLINEAARIFSREFDATFRDLAPELNAPLNRRRQQLFTASSPEQAYLGPTRPKPPEYNLIWRNDHFASLPAPYLYGISRQGRACAILTYDNTGSDYERETQEDAELVTGHIDVASAVFFIFDPTQAASFTHVLKNENGGGETKASTGTRQSPLINDLEMQLRMRFNQPPPAKLSIPFAFIISKLDKWRELLGPEQLLPATHHGRLMPTCIQANSKRLRQLLFNISPQLCRSAESFSDNVCYFAVSSFGKEPVTILDTETGEYHYAPESGSPQPEHIEDPLLWVLSRLEPHLLPKNN